MFTIPSLFLNTEPTSQRIKPRGSRILAQVELVFGVVFLACYLGVFVLSAPEIAV